MQVTRQVRMQFNSSAFVTPLVSNRPSKFTSTEGQRAVTVFGGARTHRCPVFQSRRRSPHQPASKGRSSSESDQSRGQLQSHRACVARQARAGELSTRSELYRASYTAVRAPIRTAPATMQTSAAGRRRSRPRAELRRSQTTGTARRGARRRGF